MKLRHDVALQLLRHGRVGVAETLPDRRLHLVLFTIDLHKYGRGHPSHTPDRSVHPALIRVVAQKHHLRAHLELERLVCRIRPPAELAGDLRFRGESSTRQSGERFGVDGVHAVVARRERDGAGLRRGSGAHVVETLGDLGRHHPVPHRVEHESKLFFPLPMDGAQLVDAQIGVVPHLRVEEPHRPVLVAEVGALVGIPRNRSQLIRITEQHHLHSAEGLVWLLTSLPQCPVDRVEQVGIDHRHLIDHEGFDRAEKFADIRGVTDRMIGDDPDWQPEQRMNGLTADIERRHARGRADHHLLRTVPCQIVEQCRLAGARTAGYENVLAGGLDGVEHGLLLGRQFGGEIAHDPSFAQPQTIPPNLPFARHPAARLPVICGLWIVDCGLSQNLKKARRGSSDAQQSTEMYTT